MARLILSEEEKNRIRTQHKRLSETNGALKWGHNLLFEQDPDVDVSTLEIGDVVDGKVFQGMKTKNVKKQYNELGMYAVGKDDPSKFLKTFVDGIAATVNSDEDMKNAMAEGNLQLAKATIRSGASNWYRTPLNPEVDNDYKSDVNYNYYTNPEWFPGGYESLSGPDTTDWKDNKALAQRRSTKFLEALKAALIKRGIKIFPAIEEVVTSSVVDTGGMTDEKCKDDSNCSKFRKNPGQFVDADLSFAYTSEKAKWGDFEDCTNNLKITVGYYVTYKLAKGKQLSYDGLADSVKEFNGGRASTTYHKCDRAKFKFFFNDVEVGIVNLNNGNNGLSRRGTFTVSKETVEEIINAAETGKWNPGELTLQIKGMASDPHSEVPFITMVNGRGETLLDAEASTVKSYAQAKSYKQKVPLFGPFNPCEKIAQN